MSRFAACPACPKCGGTQWLKGEQVHVLVVLDVEKQTMGIIGRDVDRCLSCGTNWLEGWRGLASGATRAVQR